MTNNLNYWTVNGLLNAGTQLGIPDFTGDTAFHNPGIPDVTVSAFMTLGNAGANWYQDDTTWHGYDQVSYRRGGGQSTGGGGKYIRREGGGGGGEKLGGGGAFKKKKKKRVHTSRQD